MQDIRLIMNIIQDMRLKPQYHYTEKNLKSQEFFLSLSTVINQVDNCAGFVLQFFRTAK